MTNDHITVECPSCGKNFQLKKSIEGKKFKCTNCQTIVTAHPKGEDDHPTPQPGSIQLSGSLAAGQRGMRSDDGDDPTSLLEDKDGKARKRIQKARANSGRPQPGPGEGSTARLEDKGGRAKKKIQRASLASQAAETSEEAHLGRILIIAGALLALLASVPGQYQLVQIMSIQGQIAELKSDHDKPEDKGKPERADYDKYSEYIKARSEYRKSDDYKKYEEKLKDWKDSRKGNDKKVRQLRKELKREQIEYHDVLYSFLFKVLASLLLLGGLSLLILKGSRAEQIVAVIALALALSHIFSLDMSNLLLM